jgi:tight adherence protein B
MELLYNSGVAMLVSMAAVFLLSLLVINVLRQALQTYQEKYLVKSVQDMSDAFLVVDGRQLFILCMCATLLLLLMGLVFFGVFFAIVLGILGFFSPIWLVKMLKARRLRKFNVQLVDSLQAMSNAFKAGMSFPQAMEQVVLDSQPPLNQEFSLFVREIKLGVSLDQALESLAARVGCEDLDLVVTSTIVARQLGGNIAEMFDTIAATIRERFRLEGKIRALTAQGKLQGWIVAMMPLVLGLVINWMRPDLMQPMFDHWFGYVLVLLIVFMELMGIFIIRKIVNIDV